MHPTFEQSNGGDSRFLSLLPVNFTIIAKSWKKCLTWRDNMLQRAGTEDHSWSGSSSGVAGFRRRREGRWRGQGGGGAGFRIIPVLLSLKQSGKVACQPSERLALTRVGIIHFVRDDSLPISSLPWYCLIRSKKSWVLKRDHWLGIDWRLPDLVIILPRLGWLGTPNTYAYHPLASIWVYLKKK